MTSDVTMIGLGAMGSALARVFIGAGHSVTLWNRTAARMKPLTSRGATAAGSPADAAMASPICVICIDNYSATRSLIEQAGMLEPLSG
jgi:3-hydroxyisobutyrate dehydrogenase-like beta-hydroxyacid dehydrogenase